MGARLRVGAADDDDDGERGKTNMADGEGFFAVYTVYAAEPHGRPASTTVAAPPSDSPVPVVVVPPLPAGQLDFADGHSHRVRMCNVIAADRGRGRDDKRTPGLPVRIGTHRGASDSIRDCMSWRLEVVPCRNATANVITLRGTTMMILR